MNIKDIFKQQYIVSASYECATKIANIADGLKISARKILYTCLDENIISKKVGQLTSKTSDKTNYIHGEISLVGVSVGLAQRFVGSNNIPLLQTDGGFGSRLIPEAAAPRYIFTGIEKYLKNIFIPEDNNILETQYFEGDKIEPKYFLPIIPLLLVNGSEGVAIGFAQYILPRNIDDILKYINRRLIGQKSNNKLLPYFFSIIIDGFYTSIRIFGININIKNNKNYSTPIVITFSNILRVLFSIQFSKQNTKINLLGFNFVIEKRG